MLSRAARLSPGARTLLDAVAVVPPQAELWLLESLADDALDRLDECLSSGMLASVSGGVAFRHELARLAVEESLPPNRKLELHRKALRAAGSRHAAKVPQAKDGDSHRLSRIHALACSHCKVRRMLWRIVNVGFQPVAWIFFVSRKMNGLSPIQPRSPPL